MGLNPKAPAWTPEPSSSGDRREDSLGGIRRAVHGVGTHKSVDGSETLGVGGLNLPAKKDKHRANLYSQRVQQAIQKKQVKMSRRKRKRGRAGRRLARAAARLTRERQKAALFYSGSTQGGQHGVALAVKQSIRKTSKFTREDVNERLMSMRFEMSGQHQAVNFVVGYAPTEPSDSEKKRAFWHRLDSLVQRIPKRRLFLC